MGVGGCVRTYNGHIDIMSSELGEQIIRLYQDEPDPRGCPLHFNEKLTNLTPENNEYNLIIKFVTLEHAITDVTWT